MDDYRKSHDENYLELVQAYGDTIVLIKEQKFPRQAVDVSGGQKLTYKDKFGGRRNFPAQEVVPVPTSYGRPEEADPEQPGIVIPAIVENARESRIVTGRGIDFNGDYVVHISRKWLDEQKPEITITPASDILVYKSVRYKITQFERYGLFLEGFSEYILGIKEIRVD